MKFSTTIRQQLRALQENRCFYCDDDMSQRRDVTVDHLIPRCLGGCLVLVMACFPCNNAKADRYPTKEELRRFLTLVRRDVPNVGRRWRKRATVEARHFMNTKLLLEGSAQQRA